MNKILFYRPLATDDPRHQRPLYSPENEQGMPPVSKAQSKLQSHGVEDIEIPIENEDLGAGHIDKGISFMKKTTTIYVRIIFR